MPTYEYACASCGHQWEEIQRISADPLEKCPACAKATAKRQISGGSFILKGGGWYSDLYSSAKPAKKDSGDSGGGGSDGSSTGGGDAKSEPKAAKPEGSKPEGSKPEGSKPTGSGDGPKAEKTKKPASGTAAA